MEGCKLCEEPGCLPLQSRYWNRSTSNTSIPPMHLSMTRFDQWLEWLDCEPSTNKLNLVALTILCADFLGGNI